MARFRWRRYRRYRRYPRRFRRRGYRRGRVINRGPRSRVKVNFVAESFVDLSWPSNSATSHQLYVCPFYQNQTPAATIRHNFMPASLVSQASYRTFAACYEQCRLIGCKVIITVNTPVGANQTFTDVSMYSCISRQFSLYDVEHNMIPWETVGASASSKRVTFVNNTVNKLGRACYASDLQERIDFVDSKPTWPNSNEVTPLYPDGATMPDQYLDCLQCQTDTDSNVVHPKFCPVFVFQGNTSDVRASNRVLKVLIRLSGTFEFRGPRFGNSSAGAAKVAAPATDARIPPPEGDDAMDIVLPDDPTQPSVKRAKLDEDDDDQCLPDDERPPAKLDEDDDDEAKEPDWFKKNALLQLGKPRKPMTGRQFVEKLLDKNGDGKVDMQELYDATSFIRALPKPVLDAAIGIAALDEGSEKPGPIYTERWKDGKVERTYDGKPVDRDPYVYKYGATAAAETEEQAKNVSTGANPEQK